MGVAIVSLVAADLASQNVVYAEAFYSPGDFACHGLQPQRLTEAIRRGLAQPDGEVTIDPVADLVRNYGPERGLRWLREVDEVRHLGVVGIGIGGSEQAFPPRPYAEVYREARERGFRTSAHAGEAAGPESTWAAALPNSCAWAGRLFRTAPTVSDSGRSVDRRSGDPVYASSRPQRSAAPSAVPGR